ncbi:MAG TPA: hypothetical protein VF587_13780 [Solirubrobacteraceae bacterium]
MSVPVAIVAGSVALAALSLLFPSAPTYDPWAWIIWGREITQLDLDTVDGPSWKPLPVLFTTVFALFGDTAAPNLWLVVARAGSIAALPLGFLLAVRLVGDRRAGAVAGLAAVAGIVCSPWWLRNGALGNSEGLLVALLFAAILAHLHDRRGVAFAFGLGVALLRPEAWPFFGLYALWLLYEDRSRLPWVAGGLVSLPILWLGPELWGSGNALRASDRAQQPNPDSAAFADNPFLAVLEDTVELLSWPSLAGVALLLALAVARRDRASLGLAAFALGWIVLVAAMTSNGFSGNLRYLIPPVALLIVLGAAGFVRAALPSLRGHPAALAVAAVALVAAFATNEIGELDDQVRSVKYQARNTDALPRVIEDSGGAAFLRDCGHAYTNPFLVPQVAWYLGVHSQEVDLDPDEERPAVVFHVKHTAGARGRAPAFADKRGRSELARGGTWIVTADCDPAQGRR